MNRLHVEEQAAGVPGGTAALATRGDDSREGDVDGRIGDDVAGAAGIHFFTTETGTPAEEQEPERGKKLPFFAAECRFGFLLIISSPPLCFFLTFGATGRPNGVLVQRHVALPLAAPRVFFP